MPTVGDNISVTITGSDPGGTSIQHTITVGKGASMTIPGRIVEDRGDSWLVELSMSVGGKNRILIPKSAQR